MTSTVHEAVVTAYHNALNALGYGARCREADHVIDLLAADEHGHRFGDLAAFYPKRRAILDAVDRAAVLSRSTPEALLSNKERVLLDLILEHRP